MELRQLKLKQTNMLSSVVYKQNHYSKPAGCHFFMKCGEVHVKF